MGGGAESQRSCAWLPRAASGRLEAPTPSPALSFLAGITALQRSSCCPPAGPLASGPGCQPAGRGGSLAGSQLTVPELSARRQARQGRDPPPLNGAPGQATGQGQASHRHSSKGPCGHLLHAGLRDVMLPGGDPGGLAPMYSAQLFTTVEGARGAEGIFKSNNNKNSNHHS